MAARKSDSSENESSSDHSRRKHRRKESTSNSSTESEGGRSSTSTESDDDYRSKRRPPPAGPVRNKPSPKGKEKANTSPRGSKTKSSKTQDSPRTRNSSRSKSPEESPSKRRPGRRSKTKYDSNNDTDTDSDSYSPSLRRRSRGHRYYRRNSSETDSDSDSDSDSNSKRRRRKLREMRELTRLRREIKALRQREREREEREREREAREHELRREVIRSRIRELEKQSELNTAELEAKRREILRIQQQIEAVQTERVKAMEAFLAKLQEDERKAMRELNDKLTNLRREREKLELAKLEAEELREEEEYLERENKGWEYTKVPPQWDREDTASGWQPWENAVKITIAFTADLTRSDTKFDDSCFTETRTPVRVQVRDKPFDAGAVRLAWHMKIGTEKWVLKTFKKPRYGRTPEQSLEAVRTQVVSAKLAEMFEARRSADGVKKKMMRFNNIVMLHFHERTEPLYCAAEPLLSGKFKKFNSNWGGADHNSSTAQALTHFSHYVSGGRLMLVDLQGIKTNTEYILTDPALHCVYETKFGKTNMGRLGMEEFFRTHKCNPICARLKLPRNELQPKEVLTAETHTG